MNCTCRRSGPYEYRRVDPECPQHGADLRGCLERAPFPDGCDKDYAYWWNNDRLVALQGFKPATDEQIERSFDAYR